MSSSGSKCRPLQNRTSRAFHSTKGFYTSNFPPTTTTIIIPPTTTTTATTAVPSSRTSTTIPTPLHLNLQAVPDYPVAEGQCVVLHCQVQSGEVQGSISWLLKRYNVTEVGKGAELKLTHPKQSGLYRCHASGRDGNLTESEEHHVSIVSTHRSAVDNLGIAGFAFAVVAFILILALVFWLVFQKFSTRPTSTPRSTGHPDSSKVTESQPPADSEGDVYMNYTCSDEGYTDLDPGNMPEDSVYSSFS